MILVDTSIWIDHLVIADHRLAALLDAQQVLSHRFVVGELALGHLRDRERFLAFLEKLPEAVVATDQEVQHMINTRRLFGRGIGYVDAHLLAAARLTGDATVWTRDKRLHAVAAALGLAAPLWRN